MPTYQSIDLIGYVANVRSNTTQSGAVNISFSVSKDNGYFDQKSNI